MTLAELKVMLHLYGAEYMPVDSTFMLDEYFDGKDAIAFRINKFWYYSYDEGNGAAIYISVLWNAEAVSNLRATGVFSTLPIFMVEDHRDDTCSRWSVIPVGNMHKG